MIIHNNGKGPIIIAHTSRGVWKVPPGGSAAIDKKTGIKLQGKYQHISERRKK